MVRRLIFMASLLAIIAMPFSTVRSIAAPLPPDDVAMIQEAIRGQLHALSEDDADSAFELTSPSIRSQMGSPENFLRLIKEEYGPIYRHLVVIFSAPQALGDAIIQIVRLTDRESRVWLAIYNMQRDMTGNWKIDGCQLLQTSVVSV